VCKSRNISSDLCDKLLTDLKLALCWFCDSCEHTRRCSGSVLRNDKLDVERLMQVQVVQHWCDVHDI